MAQRIVVSEKLIREAMQAQVVRDALDARRDRIAARAENLAAAEGIDADVRTSSGTRPKGRPYSRVSASAGQEWGTSAVEKKRMLGRAAEEAR